MASVLATVIFAVSVLAGSVVAKVHQLDVPLSRSAFVLSMNDTRWLRTAAHLRDCGFDPVVRVWPVPTAEPSLQYMLSEAGEVERAWYARTLSGLWAIKHAYTAASLHPAAFGLPASPENHPLRDRGQSYVSFFEDDAQLDEGVRPQYVQGMVNAAAVAGRDHGLFYMGMCGDFTSTIFEGRIEDFRALVRKGLHKSGAQWVESNEGDAVGNTERDSGEESNEGKQGLPRTDKDAMDKVMFGFGAGPCLHAYGIFTWRSLWLVDEAAASSVQDPEWPTRPDYPFTLDMQIARAFKRWNTALHRLPVHVGANLDSHRAPHVGAPGDDGVGIFYQAIQSLPSQRLGRVPMMTPQEVREAARADSPTGLRPSVRAPLQPEGIASVLPRPQSLRVYALCRSDRACERIEGMLGKVLGRVGARGRGNVGYEVIRLQPIDARDWIVTSLASEQPSLGARLSPGFAPAEADHLAHALTHKLAWMHVATDPGLQDGEYALVVEEEAVAREGVSPGAALGSIHASAEGSQHAGLFWLADCHAARDAELEEGAMGGNRCLLAYGIFKWRACNLWEVMRESVRRHEGEPVSFRRPLGQVLSRAMQLLHPAHEWPVGARVAGTALFSDASQ